MSRFLCENELPFLWINAREDNAASHSSCMFNFKRNSQNVFQSGCTILHSYQQCMSDPVSMQSHQNLGLSLCFIEGTLINV